MKNKFKSATRTKEGIVYSFFADIASRNVELFDKDKIYEQTPTSYAFKDCPARVFGLTSPSFCSSLHEVTNGEGSEKDKINTLHSSSLLGLLTFYKMKEPGQRMDIKIGEVNFSFERVVFERTNKVFSPSVGLSSIDIALYGKANGEDCVLYLESKFSEFLHRRKCTSSDKNKQYEQYYDCILQDNDIDVTSYNESGKMVVVSKKGEHYCEGIKQMVSHYIGALNSEDRKDHKIYLAPIIFDFCDTNLESAESFKKDGSVQDYKDIYPSLAKALNKNYDALNSLNPKNYPRYENEVIVIEEVLTYQTFFKKVVGYSLDETVKEYYNL